jgi:ABC-type sugar transport system permease subunit
MIKIKTQEKSAYRLMTPSLVVLFTFGFLPVLVSIYFSFTKYNLLTPPKWIGIQNYLTLFKDDAFMHAIMITGIYAFCSTFLGIVISILLALMLNRKARFRSALRTIVFLPFVISTSIISISWSFILDGNIGLLPYWLGLLGIHSKQGWLTDPNLALISVIAVGLWKSVGFNAIIYLAGLQTIPKDVFEVAQIDGANSRQVFRHITWPLLWMQSIFISVTALISSMQAFDQIYVMTHGGPFFSTETIVMYLYRQGFSDFKFGYASAVGTILLLIILVLSLMQLYIARNKKVEY